MLRRLPALTLAILLATSFHPTVARAADADPEAAPVEQAASAPDLPVGEVAHALEVGNQERAAAGAPPLAWSGSLATVALAHSRDMVTRRFFEHVNPDGLSPFDRMTAAGIEFQAAAENIAQDNDDDGGEVIAMWMHSPGHRQNLLNPAYGHVGLAVVANAAGERYWTQDFTN